VSDILTFKIHPETLNKLCLYARLILYTIYYMIFLKLCTGNAVQNNSTFIILVITFSFFCGLSQVPYPDNFGKTNFLVTSFLFVELQTGI